MMRIYFSILIFFGTIGIFAQNDTTLLLPPVVLQDTQIIKFKPAAKIQQFQSANRYAENLDDIPFTTHVITSDEILRNGYVTLADALKNVPGIRVSQPGNGIYGETFMMRGLLGNNYTKILINDVPIRAAAMQGVSIGAQLPIRQAERIEILYGGASSVYGGDACAGVINIILKESERPLYTQADLAFGRNGYNSLDLMFGGKIGQDKKIFRFTIYGSSTVRDETDIYNRGTLYNYDNYTSFGQSLDSLYAYNTNFGESSIEIDSVFFAKTSKIPSESRLFGAQFTWKGIAFSYNRMGRFDHSALGLNPLAASYASSTRFAERTQIVSASFRVPIWKIKTYNNFSGVFYRTDNSSSKIAIADQRFSNLLEKGIDTTLSQIDQIIVYRNFHSNQMGERYIFANSFTLRHDLRTTFQLGSKLSLDAGWQLSFHSGNALEQGLLNPFDINANFADGEGEGTFFTQINWTSKKLSFKAGISGNGSVNYFSITKTPRLAVLYKVGKKLSLYSNYTSSLRLPYFATRNENFSILRRYYPTLTPSSAYIGVVEKINNFEIGARYKINKRQINISAFQQKSYNLYRPGYFAFLDSTNYYGNRNAFGLSMNYTGIQFRMTNQAVDIDSDMQFNGKRLLILLFNEVSGQFAQGKEWFDYGILPTNAVRNQPKWTLQIRSTLRINRFETAFSIFKQSSWLSGSVFYRDQYKRDKALTTISGFTTWDWMNRFYMSEHFIVYLSFQNLWNRNYGGIDATGTPDDLLYNPQQGRLFRLGINYNMN
jgi:outer membrane receptor protein involved in Fe transport